MGYIVTHLQGQMMKYVWQSKSWPRFSWDSSKIVKPLAQARKSQGILLGQAEEIGLEIQAELLIEDAMSTSIIEGEKLDKASVRSSVAQRLGLETAGLKPPQRHVDGLVEILLDATKNHSKPLTPERLFSWQAALFPSGYSGMRKIQVGQWRQGKNPMQVVSGPIGKEKVHYQAPTASGLDLEMKRFFAWWHEASTENLDGLIRAGLAHFWFISIHPFDDGNGRIARALTDMALAQDEGLNTRLYSMSSQISLERAVYYEVLQQSQTGNGDITDWLTWFLGCLGRSMAGSKKQVALVKLRSKFWQIHRETDLNTRQRKVINRLLNVGPHGFEGGMTNRKYVNLTKISRETAKRDLADLITKKILSKRPSGGRSISYDLIWPE
jgi:Fic family protein